MHGSRRRIRIFASVKYGAGAAARTAFAVSDQEQLAASVLPICIQPVRFWFDQNACAFANDVATVCREKANRSHVV